GAAGDRPHSAELGVRQREQEDRERADPPRDDRRRPGRDQGLLGTEQPARADDGTGGRPEQADEADLAAKAGTSWTRCAVLAADDRGLGGSSAHLPLPWVCRCNGALAGSDT